MISIFAKRAFTAGSHGKPLLGEKTFQTMIELPPEPLKRRDNGTHIGLGWDNVILNEKKAYGYAKDGSWFGMRAFMKRMPNGVNAVLLFNGGTGAVINALGTGLLQLLSRSKSRELYCSDPESLSESAVEEFLRFDAPLQLFERTALEGLEFRGLRIQQGERIGLLLGAANRDPAEFMEPDSFDIRRDPNPHLTFSAGAHFCLGAPLARREMQIALPLLFTRFPELRLSSDPVPEHGFVVRGYARIPVTVS